MALKDCWQEIRLSSLAALILFFVLIIGCQTEKESNTAITIVWDNQKAIGFTIPINVLSSNSFQDIGEILGISVADHPETQVLGEWSLEGNDIKFNPLVPLSSGITYELYEGAQLIKTFKIIQPEAKPPKLVAIYPSSDTLPENLLKMYLHFSGPMQGGEAIQHIIITEIASGDTLQGTFLDLQPELWNEDNTLLTLWLDPGRIKRGLIPNRELGIPLQQGMSYSMMVDANWRGRNGVPLLQNFTKSFYVDGRDSNSPDPLKWGIDIPEYGTDNPLNIKFREPLDAILAVEALQLVDASGQPIAGQASVLNEERLYRFHPSAIWQKGQYRVLIQTRLEDLAGNNINRLFDEDISTEQVATEKGEEVMLSFKIE